MIVETVSGKLRGKARRGIATWRGVPYATAPRFRPPRPVAPWTDVRDATEFGPFAIQSRDPRAAMMSGVTDKTRTSEDCLVLNIYSPANADAKTRPVVVWIHGGAFIMGAGSQPLYDGTSFAANHDIVVVTINYRLGLLGLLYLGDLLGDEFAAGNCTLLDQIAALRWVRDNIAAFGGDPDAVTIMGESAGAISISHLLAAPAARGLFHRAILQSGAMSLTPRTREDATELAKEMIAHLGVSPRELLELPVDRFLAAQDYAAQLRGLSAFAPCVDGVTLPKPSIELVAGGSSAGVPLIVGSNREEWRLFDTFFGHASTQIVVAQLRERFGAHLDGLHARYKAARTDAADAAAWVDLVGDLAFRIPMIELAQAHLPHAPVFVYRFDHGTPMLGAAHALELPFMWNVLDSQFAQLLFGGQAVKSQPLATAMHAAWAHFIRTGTPAAPDLAAWPAYDTQRRATMIFDDKSYVADDPAGEIRAIWPPLLAATR